MAAISFDSQDVLAAFSERRGISFPLLSDQGSATIERFGILNTVAEEGLGPNADDPAVQADVDQYVSIFGALPMIVGTPFPGTLIVDPEGRVTSRFFEAFYRERNTASNIMLRLGSGTNPTAGTQGSTAHVSITAFQSNLEISAGSRYERVPVYQAPFRIVQEIVLDSSRDVEEVFRDGRGAHADRHLRLSGVRRRRVL